MDKINTPLAGCATNQVAYFSEVKKFWVPSTPAARPSSFTLTCQPTVGTFSPQLRWSLGMAASPVLREVPALLRDFILDPVALDLSAAASNTAFYATGEAGAAAVEGLTLSAALAWLVSAAALLAMPLILESDAAPPLISDVPPMPAPEEDAGDPDPIAAQEYIDRLEQYARIYPELKEWIVRLIAAYMVQSRVDIEQVYLADDALYAELAAEIHTVMDSAGASEVASGISVYDAEEGKEIRPLRGRDATTTFQFPVSGAVQEMALPFPGPLMTGEELGGSARDFNNVWADLNGLFSTELEALRNNPANERAHQALAQAIAEFLRTKGIPCTVQKTQSEIPDYAHTWEIVITPRPDAAPNSLSYLASILGTMRLAFLTAFFEKAIVLQGQPQAQGQQGQGAKMVIRTQIISEKVIWMPMVSLQQMMHNQTAVTYPLAHEIGHWIYNLLRADPGLDPQALFDGLAALTPEVMAAARANEPLRLPAERRVPLICTRFNPDLAREAIAARSSAVLDPGELPSWTRSVNLVGGYINEHGEFRLEEAYTFSYLTVLYLYRQLESELHHHGHSSDAKAIAVALASVLNLNIAQLLVMRCFSAEAIAGLQSGTVTMQALETVFQSHEGEAMGDLQIVLPDLGELYLNPTDLDGVGTSSEQGIRLLQTELNHLNAVLPLLWVLRERALSLK